MIGVAFSVLRGESSFAFFCFCEGILVAYVCAVECFFINCRSLSPRCRMSALNGRSGTLKCRRLAGKLRSRVGK